MKYCIECGNKLIDKYLEHEGMIPYCNKCNQYRFPQFNVAVSMVIINRNERKTLFIKQYGMDRNILVAGYVNKGEEAEHAVYREMKEEIGIEPISIKFQKSRYWEKSNTLLFNFLAIVDTLDIKPNYEVDSYKWFDIDEALDVVAKGGLAEEFFAFFYKNNQNVL